MIKYKTGNILTEDVEALINTVNCVGVMGRGIALQFKKAFPENFKAYTEVCKQGKLQPGRMFVFELDQLTNPRYIINFPTKRHWRGKSRMKDIDAGLTALANELQSRDIRSIAVPPLGSGLGGLDWDEVRPRIEAALRDFSELEVVIFEPGGGTADNRINRSSDVPKMTAGRAALVGLMDRYLQGLLDPMVTLLEIHKLMYFMQVSGEPLRLQFAKGPYGPYAENLRHVLNAIEGHFVSGYADGGDAPTKQISLVPGVLDDAYAYLNDKLEIQAHLARVSDLVEGFESPFGLELLSTVHWVATQEHAETLDEVLARTYAWNERKRQFSKRQIGLAADVLSHKDWISNYAA